MNTQPVTAWRMYCTSAYKNEALIEMVQMIKERVANGTYKDISDVEIRGYHVWVLSTWNVAV